MTADTRDKDHLSVQTGLAWGLLAIVLLSSLALGANRPLAWIILSLLVMILFLVQLALDARRAPAPARADLPMIALLYMGVVGWTLVQSMAPVPMTLAHPVWALAPEGAVPRISADPGSGPHVSLRLAAYAMIAWIFAAAALNSRRAWKLVRAIALFSSALAVFGLAATLTNNNPILGDDIHVGYVTAGFRNRNSYATYAAFGLMANLVAYMDKTRHIPPAANFAGAVRNRLESFFEGAWLYLMGVILCAVAIALTGSRGGAAATLAGALVLVGLLARRGKGGWTLWAGAGGLTVFVIAMFGSETIGRLIDPRVEEQRFRIYAEVLDQIAARPLLGHGAGAFRDSFRPHVPLEAGVADWTMAHSSYLENFHEFGIPAAIAFYLAIALVVMRLIKGVRRRRGDTMLPAFALACVVTGGSHAAIDFSLQMPATAALFAAILGIGWAQSYPSAARSAPAAA